jgi:hypothetical protein
MDIWRIVGPVYMTGALLIVPGIFVTGPLAMLAMRMKSKTSTSQRRMLLIPLLPVVGIWSWAAAYARIDPHKPIDLSRSYVVEALTVISIVTALGVLQWQKRQWRVVWPYLALAAWVACMACVAGLWCIEGWPAL